MCAEQPSLLRGLHDLNGSVWRGKRAREKRPDLGICSPLPSGSIYLLLSILQPKRMLFKPPGSSRRSICTLTFEPVGRCEQPAGTGAAAPAAGRQAGTAVPDVPRAPRDSLSPGVPPGGSLVPGGEPSGALPLWGCSRPCRRHFLAQISAKPLEEQRAPVISCQRPPWGCSELLSPPPQQPRLRAWRGSCCQEHPWWLHQDSTLTPKHQKLEQKKSLGWLGRGPSHNARARRVWFRFCPSPCPIPPLGHGEEQQELVGTRGTRLREPLSSLPRHPLHTPSGLL